MQSFDQQMLHKVYSIYLFIKFDCLKILFFLQLKKQFMLHLIILVDLLFITIKLNNYLYNR